MGYHDNLPPGVSVSDIPGNRPEDIAWDREAARWFDEPSRVIEVCERERDCCWHAEWIPCPVCGGTGERGGYVCERCGGEGDIFDRCSLKVWRAAPHEVPPYEVRDATDCPTIARMIDDAATDAIYGPKEDYRDDE
jgi:hypothetical protein